MEENTPTPQPDSPPPARKPRRPRAEFSAPQSAPATGRRSAGKDAPALTFQPPVEAGNGAAAPAMPAPPQKKAAAPKQGRPGAESTPPGPDTTRAQGQPEPATTPQKKATSGEREARATPQKAAAPRQGEPGGAIMNEAATPPSTQEPVTASTPDEASTTAARQKPARSRTSGQPPKPAAPRKRNPAKATRAKEGPGTGTDVRADGAEPATAATSPNVTTAEQATVAPSAQSVAPGGTGTPGEETSSGAVDRGAGSGSGDRPAAGVRPSKPRSATRRTAGKAAADATTGNTAAGPTADAGQAAAGNPTAATDEPKATAATDEPEATAVAGAPKATAPETTAHEEARPATTAATKAATTAASAAASDATSGPAEPAAPTTAPADTAPQPAGALAVSRAGEVGTVADAPGVVERIMAEPGRVPEVLALLAVERLGPAAAEWAEEVREAYPQAGRDEMARLALRSGSRRGLAVGAAAALAGGFALPVGVGAALWAQAGTALRVAAAYGRDPADPARAADLLVVWGVHPSLREAERALAGPEPDSVWRVGAPVLVQAVGWWALRSVGRLVPGAALLVATLTGRSAVERVGVRAVAHFRSR